MKSLDRASVRTMFRTTTLIFSVVTILFCTQELVAQRVMITTESLPAGVVNVAYSQTLTATNGIRPYTWTIVSGTLPSGLVLVPSTGLIAGTPAAEGTSNFRVRVTTSSLQPDEKNLSIAINRAPVTTGGSNLKIKTQSLSPGLRTLPIRSNSKRRAARRRIRGPCRADRYRLGWC